MYDFAASDGSEAYSLIISLIEILADEAEKFFPISAYDIDEAMINRAKSGIVNCNHNDLRLLTKNTSHNLRKYFIADKSDNIKEKDIYPYKLTRTQLLKELVEFQLGDFIEKLDEIEGENSLVLCRNFWPYLTESEIKTAFEKMAKILKPSSLVIVGDYDVKVNIDKYFRDYGFEQITENIYKKSSDKNRN